MIASINNKPVRISNILPIILLDVLPTNTPRINRMNNIITVVIIMVVINPPLLLMSFASLLDVQAFEVNNN